MKKLYVYILMILLSFYILTPIKDTEFDFEVPVASASGAWVDYMEPITVGQGTSSSPYEISTAGQFQYLNEFFKDSSKSKANYIITQDLDFSAHFFETISYRFFGTLDGNNKFLKGLTTDPNVSNSGLLSSATDATIKNLIFEEVNIKSRERDNGVLLNESINSQISNVLILSGSISVEANVEWGSVGGVIGSVKGGNINKILNNAKMSIYTSVGNVYIGGVFGLQIDSGTYDSLVNYADMYIYDNNSAPSMVGGLIGAVHDDEITNCFVVNNIYKSSESYDLVGALMYYNGIKTSFCYYESNILPAIEWSPGVTENIITNTNMLPDNFDRKIWGVSSSSINNGKPYLKWLYWESLTNSLLQKYII